MSIHTRLTRSAAVLLVSVAGLALAALPAGLVTIGAPAGAQTDPLHASAPSSLLFVENAGQWPGAARFQVWGSPLDGGTTWLTDDAIWITVPDERGSELHRSDGRMDRPADLLPVTSDDPRRGVNLKLTFPGTNSDVRIEPFDPLTTTVSYFGGADPAQWRPAVPMYGGVRYANLYPGVDLVLGANDVFWQLEVQPEAEAGAARLRVEGADGAVLAGDVLWLTTAVGELGLALPRSSGALEVEAIDQASASSTFTLHPGGRQPGPFQPGASFAPDASPAGLLYSTFLGGASNDAGHAIAVDGTGSAYAMGSTNSSNFPTTPGSYDPSYNADYDVFVVKLNPVGSGLTYATFLGGSAWDQGLAIAVDGAGSAYVTGETNSSDFPTTSSAYDTSYNGDQDAFVTKLNPAGSGLAYATFLGGSSGDGGADIAVDRTGSAYVTGPTNSGNFPTTPGVFDPSYNGDSDAFVVKLNPAGCRPDYATFLGGSGYDGGYDIAVDGVGSAYVTGRTSSSDFPATSGAYDASFNGGNDVLVAKLNAAGSGLAYATFLGGNDSDVGLAVAVDGTGSAYVTGWTYSSTFPVTQGAFDPSYNGHDAFVAKLNPAGSRLGYATFLGGASFDGGSAIVLDEVGSAYLTGWTHSSDFPTTPGAFEPTHAGSSDAFAAKLNAAGSRLVYATFLGGSEYDSGSAIAVNGAGNAYVTGYTGYGDFPTTAGAFDTSYNGAEVDAFVAKLAMSATPPPPHRRYLPLIRRQ